MSRSGGLTHRQQNLLATLGGLVPLYILDMRGWTFEERRACLDIEAIAYTADVLMYSSGPKRGKAERDASVRALNALARGIAVAAFQPGGITVVGRHWCVHPHRHCPARPAPGAVPAPKPTSPATGAGSHGNTPRERAPGGCFDGGPYRR